MTFVQVSPGEYCYALKDNWAWASLTHFETDEELEGYQIFRMEDDEVYYSISPQGEITGVINNEVLPSFNFTGSALSHIIPHAIAHGGTWLTCWNVNGKLPSMYEQYGFRITKEDQYDSKTYGPPDQTLIDCWIKCGWEPIFMQGSRSTILNYPSVVTMQYQP